jgi:3-hydroxyacyl-CoA dehydrogenase/enoyl-CoA hydratase/3-hydroxybutyryl-CoA epimerase
MTQNMISWEPGIGGVVVLTMDDPDHAANTLNETFRSSFAQTVDRLEAEKDHITGVILTSAKKTFFAGADLAWLRGVTRDDAAALGQSITEFKAQLRRLETLGRPVVAAINGAALGGGLEIALACHHRVALDAPGSTIGFPEVTLGLLPGGGGVARTVRMFGIQKALMEMLLQGQQYRPSQAADIGLVDELAHTPETMMDAAHRWIRDNPEPSQPWDITGHSIPGGTPANPSFAAMLPAFPANLRKQLKGAPMPAPHHIMSAAVEGAQTDIENALRLETEYFVALATGQVSTNMIQAFFFDMQHVAKGGSRPEGYAHRKASRVAVLGAGMMGAGIAYVCARNGIEVVLKDVSIAAAEKGKGYSATLLDKAVARGRMTEDAAAAILDRIVPTADYADAEGADVMIEAVFEDVGLKKQVYADLEPRLASDALLASNTSTLPITELAEGVSRPKDFIGMHFFSPVDKMRLLEIVVGEQTSDETLARAIDLALQIKKLPIVVNDSRGFFTSRVIGFFVKEAIAMLAEGIPAPSIEQAGLQAGYPTAPLALTDEISLTLWQRIRDQSKAAAEAEGQEFLSHPWDHVIDQMVVDFGRGGRAAGAGFYDYAEGKRVGLWSGLAEHYHQHRVPPIPFEDMKERMLVAEAIDSVRCLDEGVLRSVPDANIGSIFGIGYPAWTGGVLQYINGYPGGPAGFVARARELAERYGDRFTPPDSLVALAESGGRYE